MRLEFQMTAALMFAAVVLGLTSNIEQNRDFEDLVIAGFALAMLFFQ